MRKHTPGPWSIDPPIEPNCLSIREGTDGYRIATVWEDDARGIMEADARLICAAPDLLEACRAALAELPGNSEAAYLLKRAIAKATEE